MGAVRGKAQGVYDGRGPGQAVAQGVRLGVEEVGGAVGADAVPLGKRRRKGGADGEDGRGVEAHQGGQEDDHH